MFLHKIKKGIKEYGLLIYSAYILRIFFEHTSKSIRLQLVYLFVMPVDTSRIKIPSFLSKSFNVEILEKYHDLLSAFPVSRKTLDYRFQQNAVCLVASKKGRPVGYLWLILKEYHEDTMYCTFKMGDQIAWDFELWVHDDFRLSPAFSVLWQSAFEYLADKGIQQVYSRISTTNTNSVQIHTRMGGHVVGKLLFFRFLNREICIDTVTRRLSLNSAQRRHVIILDSLETSKNKEKCV